MKDKDANDDELNQDDQDNINEADDSFGLPDLEFNTLDEEAEEDSAEPEEDTTETEEAAEEVVDEAEEQPESGSDDDLDEQASDDESSEVEEGTDQDDAETEEESTEDTPTTRTYVPPKAESNAPKLIAALIITILASLGIWYFMFYQPQAAEAEKAQIEQLRKDEAAKRAAAIKAENERKTAAAAQAETTAEEEEAAKTGDFNIIFEPTGRYYVVIESFVDSDLAADYGNKLAAEGVGSALISPKGERKFHRLTIGDFDSFVDAQEEANKLKADYGDDLWVLKY